MAIKNQIKKKMGTPIAVKSEKSIVLQLDYPGEGEMIVAGHYAIRISAGAGSDVEISIENGDWMSCRYAVGHWWFDWYPSGQGVRLLKARARMDQGKWVTSNEIRCQVIRN